MSTNYFTIPHRSTIYLATYIVYTTVLVAANNILSAGKKKLNDSIANNTLFLIIHNKEVGHLIVFLSHFAQNMLELPPHSDFFL